MPKTDLHIVHNAKETCRVALQSIPVGTLFYGEFEDFADSGNNLYLAANPGNDSIIAITMGNPQITFGGRSTIKNFTLITKATLTVQEVEKDFSCDMLTLGRENAQ